MLAAAAAAGTHLFLSLGNLNAERFGAAEGAGLRVFSPICIQPEVPQPAAREASKKGDRHGTCDFESCTKSEELQLQPLLLYKLEKEPNNN